MLMYVKMVLAMSINGRITNSDDSNPAHWTSKEDQQHIMSVYKSSDVVVIGRNTYEAGPTFFGSLPVKVAVMSHDTSPEVAKKLPRNVRFINGAPENILKHFGEFKANRILIAGGGVVNADFLKAGLVDEIVITVEPKIFGKGKLAFAEQDFTADFRLSSVKWLNSGGSIILTYRKAPAAK